MRQVGSISRRADRRAQARSSTARPSLARAFDVEVREISPGRGQARCIRISMSTTWSAPCICRSTASAIRPTSPWRWPRARASAARRSSRASKVTAVHHDERPGHRRRLGDRRRRTGARSRPTSSSTAPACGRASLRRCSGVTVPLHACEHFYLVTEADRRAWPPAGAARAGRMRLLQGGRRQDDARRLRAAGQAVGHGRHPRGFLLRPAAGGFRAFRADPGNGASNRMPMLADGRHPHLLQRARELHARRPLLSRRGAGACRLLGRGRLQFRSASSRPAAPAWRWRNGSTTASRPSTSGRSTSAAPSRSRSNRRYLQRAGDRDARPALCRPLPLPPDGDRARRAPLADARASEGARRRLRRSGRLGARQLVRRDRARRAEYRYSGSGRTGSTTSATNIWPCATASACST